MPSLTGDYQMLHLSQVQNKVDNSGPLLQALASPLLIPDSVAIYCSLGH